MIYLGYDPGGNNKHGVAAFRVEAGIPPSVNTALLASAEEVIDWFGFQAGDVAAIGVDTLTCWSTGPSGWRPADHWLKQRYPDVAGSVAAPNSLYGSMSLNGMAVLLALRAESPELLITETHPKVLHWHFRKAPYDYVADQILMNDLLAEQLGCKVQCNSDHEWDAAMSALVAYRCETHEWKVDLHSFPVSAKERLIMPCGRTKYAWPY